MSIEQFLRLVDILEKNIDSNSAAMKLRNCYKRVPYTILMTTLLSLRTKDENTAKVASVLFNHITTPQQLLQIPLEQLEQIVKPTGMYKQKAKTLQEVSKVLIEQFNSKVPTSKEELLSIKGIGEKTANIVLNNALDKPNIAVDTHVHRICNLLKIVDTKDEKETSKLLNQMIPNEYKSKINFTLVSFGQTICKVKKPLCQQCLINTYCPKW